jgi:hypothetical protein
VGPIPPLFQIFPGGAAPGWFAVLHFAKGNLVVALFDQNSILSGQTVYPGLAESNFGFYIQGPCGIWFSQDTRNTPPGPQTLTYFSNLNPGDFWLAWEACTYEPAATFDQVVIYVDDSHGDPFPTPTAPVTWGRVKSLYRN